VEDEAYREALSIAYPCGTAVKRSTSRPRAAECTVSSRTTPRAPTDERVGAAQDPVAELAGVIMEAGAGPAPHARHAGAGDAAHAGSEERRR
jgi:hypothetical protein